MATSYRKRTSARRHNPYALGADVPRSGRRPYCAPQHTLPRVHPGKLHCEALMSASPHRHSYGPKPPTPPKKTVTRRQFDVLREIAAAVNECGQSPMHGIEVPI